MMGKRQKSVRHALEREMSASLLAAQRSTSGLRTGNSVWLESSFLLYRRPFSAPCAFPDGSFSLASTTTRPAPGWAAALPRHRQARPRTLMFFALHAASSRAFPARGSVPALLLEDALDSLLGRSEPDCETRIAFRASGGCPVRHPISAGGTSEPPLRNLQRGPRREKKNMQAERDSPPRSNLA